MTRTSSHATGRPLTVGFVVEALGDSYQWEILQGALDAARDGGANLLCFEGGAFHAEGEGSGSGLLSLIDPRSVDGLVVLAGALGNEVGADALGALCERWRPLPMCFVALNVPGFSSVSADNGVGARGVLGHLVVHHGMRRVAFVRGPEANAEAEGRFAAYREVLAGASIPFDPALVAPGDFTPEAGRRAVSLLLDERSRHVADLEAIACANDAMALGVLEALERRRIRVPEELALVGFDDVAESRFTTPPLTTVRQPLRRQGREAVRMVLSPDASIERIVLPTELCVRRSCGCFPRRAAAKPPSRTPTSGMEATLIARRDVIVADLSRAARGAFSAAGNGWEARLVQAFLGELVTGRAAALGGPQIPAGVAGAGVAAQSAGFVETYDDILRRLMAAGIDPSICYDVVATLRRHLLRCMGPEPRERALTEGLLEQIGELTGTVMERVQAWQRIDAERRAHVLARVGAVLTSVFEDGDMARAVGAYLPSLGVQSCHLVSVGVPAPDAAPAQRIARLLLTHDGDAHVTQRVEEFFYPANEVLPYAAMTPGRHAAHAVVELWSRDGELLVLIVDLGQAEGHVYEALRHLFGAAVEGARLAAEQRALTAKLSANRERMADVTAVRDALAAAMDRRRALGADRLEATLEAARIALDRIIAGGPPEGA